MRFKIKRTSYCTPFDKKPCEEALKDENDNWIVEFLFLDNLMEFIQKYDRCIIFSNNVIEIYDDYRE